MEVICCAFDDAQSYTVNAMRWASCLVGSLLCIYIVMLLARFAKVKHANRGNEGSKRRCALIVTFRENWRWCSLEENVWNMVSTSIVIHDPFLDCKSGI